MTYPAPSSPVQRRQRRVLSSVQSPPPRQLKRWKPPSTPFDLPADCRGGGVDTQSHLTAGYTASFAETAEPRAHIAYQVGRANAQIGR